MSFQYGGSSSSSSQAGRLPTLQESATVPDAILDRIRELEDGHMQLEALEADRLESLRAAKAAALRARQSSSCQSILPSSPALSPRTMDREPQLNLQCCPRPCPAEPSQPSRPCRPCRPSQPSQPSPPFPESLPNLNLFSQPFSLHSRETHGSEVHQQSSFRPDSPSDFSHCTNTLPISVHQLSPAVRSSRPSRAEAEELQTACLTAVPSHHRARPPEPVRVVEVDLRALDREVYFRSPQRLRLDGPLSPVFGSADRETPGYEHDEHDEHEEAPLPSQGLRLGAILPYSSDEGEDLLPSSPSPLHPRPPVSSSPADSTPAVAQGHQEARSHRSTSLLHDPLAARLSQNIAPSSVQQDQGLGRKLAPSPLSPAPLMRCLSPERGEEKDEEKDFLHAGSAHIDFEKIRRENSARLRELIRLTRATSDMKKEAASMVAWASRTQPPGNSSSLDEFSQTSPPDPGPGNLHRLAPPSHQLEGHAPKSFSGSPDACHAANSVAPLHSAQRRRWGRSRMAEAEQKVRTHELSSQTSSTSSSQARQVAGAAEVSTPLPPVYAASVAAAEREGWQALHPLGDEPCWTVLHWAASEGRRQLCSRLLATRADPLLQDEYGRNALDCAWQAGFSDLWHLLASHLPQ